MTILFDENVSHHLVEFLHRADAPGNVQHVQKLGWRGTPDVEWMTRAFERGFAVVTADRNEKTRGLRAQDIKAMGGQMVMLGAFWDHLTIWHKAKWLVANWEKILAVLTGMSGGACVVIDKYGKITPL